MKLRRVFIIVLLVGVVAGVGFFYTSQNGKKPQKIGAITKGNLEKTLTLSGEIGAHERVKLQFQSSGMVSWVGVSEGDYVQENTAIAGLDTRSIKKNLQKDLNDFVKARYDLDQTRENTWNKVYTDELKRIVEKSQYDLNNAVLDVELNDIALKFSTLTTPIEGIVTRADVTSEGVNIVAASTFFEIVNPNTLFFEVTADQTEVVDLYETQGASVVLDPFPESTFSARIKKISYVPKEDESGTVYQVELGFDALSNEVMKFRYGMTGDATLITQTKQNVLYIPVTALKNDQSGSYITVGENKEKRIVSTGLETDDFIEISGPISEGEVLYD